MEKDYTHYLAVGGRLNSNGWAATVQYFRRRTALQDEVWSLAFSEIRHEKQVRQQRPTAFTQYGQATPYVFGKVNHVYALQLGYGRELLLLPGIVEDNLSLRFRYMGGLSLALLKPYYLKLVYADNVTGTTELREERYSGENAEQFLRPGYAMGAAKWGMGLDEVKPVPGLFLEAAAVIEVANSKALIQSVSIGANGAMYNSALPIMAEVKASPIHTSVFIGLALGKRWKPY